MPWYVWIAFWFISNQTWAEEQTRNEKVTADSFRAASTIVKHSTKETSAKVFYKSIFNTIHTNMFRMWQMWNLFDSKSILVTLEVLEGCKNSHEPSVI